jgi:hypothetical protein
MNRWKLTVTLVFSLGVTYQTTAMGAEKNSRGNKKASLKIDSSKDPDEFVTAPSTRIDFSETTIDGRMKAPEGFMLQGQKGNSLSQMVKLRSHFRGQLNNSKSATKALVK